ncbi:hypothetical protein BU17DRAFT_71850 [Hysterangium stoloniferum]|nr:hypothetical protein BU17DRAFT_71850 [Hysterangium stoloniferum]
MILLEDKRAPPPPYPASESSPIRQTGNGPKLSDLPPNILLHIVEATFPPYIPVDGLAGQRRTLYWLTVSLRLVNRSLYMASMHILRSTYFEAYTSLVKSPYTSDPFPTGSAGAGSDTDSHVLPPIQSIQREAEVFDLFIALKTREDVWLDDSELHLRNEDGLNDLFAVMQPRRRIEDLLRYYGLRYGFITLSDSPARRQRAIPFSYLTVSFSPRKVGVLLLTPAVSRTPQRRTVIAECIRDRDEILEISAKKLAKALGRYIHDTR